MKIKIAVVLSMLVVIVQNRMGEIVTQDNLTLLNCSFENGMFGWNNISVAWKIGQGSRAKSGTGPTQDHTLRNDNGSFLYLDSQAVNASQTQMLQSPFVQWNDSCFSLWYHMRGNDTGNLSIYIETNITTGPSSTTTKSSNRTILWSQEGELDDKWYAIEITIQTEEDFRVLLEGTTKGKYGNIAVDDIKLSKYSCKDVCSFDAGLCNWMQRKSDGFRWIRTSGNKSTRKTGPQSGHTNKSADDYYMHIDASLGNKSSSAILHHAGLYRSGPACLSFWYHMYGTDMGKLILTTSRNDQSITTVWCKSGDQGNNWNFAAVDVEVGPDVSVQFEAVRGYGGRSDMALDDISMIIGTCSEQCTRSTSAPRDFKKCCINFNGNETERTTATLIENCGANSQMNTSGSQTKCCVNFNGNETEQMTATLFESCGANSQMNNSGSQTTCYVNFNGNETKQITATLFVNCGANSQMNTSGSQTTCCVNFNGNETEQITATLFESCGANSQMNNSGSQTTCYVNFNGNETKQITATLFVNCGANSQMNTSGSQTTCCVNFNGNETEQITATLFENCGANSQMNNSGSQTTCCVNFNGNETEQTTATLLDSCSANSQTSTCGSQTTSNEHDSIAKDTWTASSESDLEHSTTNEIRLVKEKATVTDGVIIGSVFGAVVFLGVSLLFGVRKCRKRRRHSKKAESIELGPISSKVSRIEDGMGDNSSAAHFVNPVYTQSSNAARPGNTALINVETDNENYEYASAFTPTTPVQWTEGAYDTCDETKHHVDGAYDHIPTHFIEEYETTQLTMHTRQDANETYDHVTICPDVYDETNVMAQTTAIQYKSYDHATKGTCQTPDSKQNVSSNQDDIYELIA